MAKAIEGVCSHEGALPEAPGYLVAGHGLTTWASDVPSLRRHLEALEHLLACELAEWPTTPSKAP
jgi:methylthioribulose-1-phosphate dehydratase